MVLHSHWCNLIDQATEGMRRPIAIGPEQATHHLGRCCCYLVSNFLKMILILAPTTGKSQAAEDEYDQPKRDRALVNYQLCAGASFQRACMP
jgi:hypothetical protein